MRAQLEGSRVVAEAVKLCRPHVICAYPITPQTHIVEELAQMVADGQLKAEFINVESEFAAASVILGASAVGARAYTATSSQGLALMAEVLFNIAGLRLPVVLTCANRALSAPISIWNDHQDAMMVRDSGFIQLFAEDNQEALDLHIQAFKIGERMSLPVMINVDGFILTHAFEPVDVPDQEAVDAFVPPYQPARQLDPDSPLTFGALVDPDSYMETRYALHHDLERAAGAIEEVARQFRAAFGRPSGGLIGTYRTDDAETVLVAMGSVLGTIKESVDVMREQGKKVGAVKIVTFRPFPRETLRQALVSADRVLVMEKALSPGSGGILAAEVRELFHGRIAAPSVSSFIVGLGGRDVTIDTVRNIVARAELGVIEGEFVELKPELVAEGIR